MTEELWSVLANRCHNLIRLVPCHVSHRSICCFLVTFRTPLLLCTSKMLDKHYGMSAQPLFSYMVCPEMLKARSDNSTAQPPGQNAFLVLCSKQRPCKVQRKLTVTQNNHYSKTFNVWYQVPIQCQDIYGSFDIRDKLDIFRHTFVRLGSNESKCGYLNGDLRIFCLQSPGITAKPYQFSPASSPHSSSLLPLIKLVRRELSFEFAEMLFSKSGYWLFGIGKCYFSANGIIMLT